MPGLSLPSFNVEIIIGPALAWALFAITLLFFLLVTISLTYHWKKFALEEGSFKTVTHYYYGISALLIGVSLVCLIMYTMSVAQ